MSTVVTCPKCSSSMKEGFVLDHTRHAPQVSHWYAGKAENSFWIGVKTSGLENHPIQSYRCYNCGYLEMYAGH